MDTESSPIFDTNNGQNVCTKISQLQLYKAFDLMISFSILHLSRKSKHTTSFDFLLLPSRKSEAIVL